MRWCKTGYKQVNDILDRFSALIWRLLEIHVFKAVAFTVFLVCLNQVSLQCTRSLCKADGKRFLNTDVRLCTLLLC